MDVREKLVELIESARYWGSNTSEEIADHLLRNGVTVRGCGEWVHPKGYVVSNGFCVQNVTTKKHHIIQSIQDLAEVI